MALYRVTYFGPDGSISHRESVRHEHDDQVIDRVGFSNYAHEVQIHRGRRLVALFPKQLWALHG